VPLLCRASSREITIAGRDPGLRPGPPLRAGPAAADRDGRKRRYRAIAPEYESRDLSALSVAVGRSGYRPVRRGHFRGFAVADDRLTARGIIDVI